MLMSLLSNLLVLVVLFSANTFQQSSSFFFASLCLADLGITVFGKALSSERKTFTRQCAIRHIYKLVKDWAPPKPTVVCSVPPVVHPLPRLPPITIVPPVPLVTPNLSDDAERRAGAERDLGPGPPALSAPHLTGHHALHRLHPPPRHHQLRPLHRHREQTSEVQGKAGQHSNQGF